jgi:hypothetical protein
MARLASLLLFLGLASGPLWAQRADRDTVFALEKLNGRTKHLRKYRTVTLLLTDTLPRATTERMVHRAEGNLLDVSADAITLDLHSEVLTRTRLETPTDYPLEWQREEHAWSDTVPHLATYPLRLVKQVEVERKLKGTGTAITVFSLLGLLVYAPLKAMSFRTGTFDGEKYLQVATPCVIGVGVGLVVMPFTEGRHVLKVRMNGAAP